MNVKVDMDQVSRMRMRAAWFRDVPNIPLDAELYEWAANEIEGLRENLAEAERVLRRAEQWLTKANGTTDQERLYDVRAILAKITTVSQEI